EGSHAMMQITGEAGITSVTKLDALKFKDIMDAFNTGIAGVTFATKSKVPDDTKDDFPLVGGHVYMMVSFDATNQTITLRNPWGNGPIGKDKDGNEIPGSAGTYDTTTNPPTFTGSFGSRAALEIITKVGKGSFLENNFDAFYGLNLL